MINGGYMPIWDDALAIAGLDPGRRHVGAPHRGLDGTLERLPVRAC